MRDFTIKTGDTEPAIAAILKNEDNQPRDLSNVQSVQFHMQREDDGTTVVDAQASVVSASDGKVAYEWSAGDTDAAGRYDAEFEVTYNDGGTETFPNYRDITVVIGEDIA